MTFLIVKGIRIFLQRVRTEGLLPALVWLYGRGMPVLTGSPIMKYGQVTPDVYVGTQYRKPGKRKLEKLGFTGCVNLRVEFDDAAYGLNLKHYCYLPTVDGEAPTLDQLRQGVTFIDEVVAGGGKVYIHCRGGIGRAPTMAAAYLISRGLSAEEATGLIKKSRPFIGLHSGQWEQLKRFEVNWQENKV